MIRLKGFVPRGFRSATHRVTESGLSRWLRGEPTISIEKIIPILSALDLPDGLPRENKVCEWKYNVLWEDRKDAIRLYFPDGAQVMRAGWSRPGFRNAMKYLSLAHIRKTAPREMYLFKQKNIRAIFRMPPGILMGPEDLGKGYRWKEETMEESAFDTGENEDAWLNGPVSQDIFDEGWNSKYINWKDAVKLAQQKKVPVSRVVSWLKTQ